jgi:hypothetical protein
MIPIRNTYTAVKPSSNRRKRKSSTKVNTEKSNSLKSMILKELMETIPDDLSKFKSFELKFETKSVYIKSEGF